MSTQKRNRIPGIYSYVLPSGVKRWGAVLDDGTRQQRHQKRKRGFATQDAAHVWRMDYLAKHRRGEITEPSLLPLWDYFEEWLQVRSATIRPSTTRNYRRSFALLRNDLGAIPLARVTPSLIERAYAVMLGRVQPSTARSAHRVLRMLLRTAIRDGLLLRNPAEHVPAPGIVRSNRQTWSVETARLFLAGCAGDRYEDAWHLFLECWIRSGELQALRWSDLDLSAGTLTVNQSATVDAAGKITVGLPKSESSRRTLALSPSLVERLRHRKHEQKLESMLLGLGWSDDRLVFTSLRGKMLLSATLSNALRETCQRLGIAHVGVHGLRHTGGSIAYGNGVPIKLISERMGHASINFTINLYMHTNEGQHRELAATMGKLLG